MNYKNKLTGEKINCIQFDGHNQELIVSFAPKAYALTKNGKLCIKGSSFEGLYAHNNIINKGDFVVIEGKNAFGQDNVFALDVNEFHEKYTLFYDNPKL